MNKITLFSSSVLGKIAFWMLLMAGPALWAQPTVKVPSTCEVVVTGSGVGVALGFGGIVGNGGIVVMPDPFDVPGNNFNVVTNGTTISSWSLKGDISVQTNNIPPAAPTQGAGALLSLNIESYNKTLRPAEAAPLYPQSDKIWGRSKGRVILNYVQAPCNNSITFEIFKRYDNNPPTSWVPPIVGPECLLPLTTYTYSVDQIASDNAGDAIGFDRYYWSGIPAGSTAVYTSADESSITFTTGSTVPAPITIQCCYGRANKWDGDAGGSHITCVTKTIGATPVQPQYTTPPPTCLATGTSSFNVTVNPIAIVPGYTYVWSAPGTSWTLAQSGTQNANVTVTGMDNNPGTLVLTISNGACQPVSFTYNVNRNFVSPLAITGSTCVTAGSIVNYALPANAQINPTTWTLPGWSISSSNGPGSVINVQIPPGTSAGTYNISATAANCIGSSISLAVNVRPAAPAFVTTPAGTSPNCVIRNGGPAVTYTVTPSPGATGYSWVFPAGWSPQTITTASPTVTVTPGGSASSANVAVTALAAAGCSSTTTNYAVGYVTVAPNTFIVSCWSLGVPGTTTITIPNAPSPFYGTYTVSSSPAGLFSSYSVNPTTGVITLNTLASAVAGTYNITVTHTSPGGCSAGTTTLPVTVAGNGSTIAITANVPGAGNCDQYAVSNVPAGATLTWLVNGVVTVANGSTVFVFGNTLVLCGNTAPTSVCADVSLNGCTTRVCSSTVGTHGARLANPSTKESDELRLYPNPNDGNFKVFTNSNAVATINDAAGRFIKTFDLQKGENDITIQGLAQGIYIISFEVNGKKEIKQFIVK